MLLADVNGLEKAAWQQLQKRGRLGPRAIVKSVGLAEEAVELALGSPVRKRVLLRDAAASEYLSIRPCCRKGRRFVRSNPHDDPLRHGNPAILT